MSRPIKTLKGKTSSDSVQRRLLLKANKPNQDGTRQRLNYNSNNIYYEDLMSIQHDVSQILMMCMRLLVSSEQPVHINQRKYRNLHTNPHLESELVSTAINIIADDGEDLNHNRWSTLRSFLTDLKDGEVICNDSEASFPIHMCEETKKLINSELNHFSKGMNSDHMGPKILVKRLFKLALQILENSILKEIN